MNSGNDTNVINELKKMKKHFSNDNLVMDVASLDNHDSQSKGGRTMKHQPTTEETVEDLLAKLEMKGKKVVLADQLQDHQQ